MLAPESSALVSVQDVSVVAASEDAIIRNLSIFGPIINYTKSNKNIIVRYQHPDSALRANKLLNNVQLNDITLMIDFVPVDAVPEPESSHTQPPLPMNDINSLLLELVRQTRYYQNLFKF